MGAGFQIRMSMPPLVLGGITVAIRREMRRAGDIDAELDAFAYTDSDVNVNAASPDAAAANPPGLRS